MKTQIKRDIIYMILNHVVCHIPCWTVRRIFYVLFGMRIGKGARIAMNVKVLCPRKIAIGDHTIINDNCYLDGRGGLIIGKNCSISYNTSIISASHKVNSKVFEYYEDGVVIEDFVWTGVNVTILDGSVLEQGCVLGAGSVIKGIAKKNGIYLGIPARLKKVRNIPHDTDLMFKAYFR